jgi:tRNA modification GTPase
MSASLHDLIAAIATAPGRAGVGVVRVSGKQLDAVAAGLIGKTPKPRSATLAAFRDAAGTAIDTGIVLYFKAPQSYTGEDVLELQGHGGPVVLNLLLQRCIELGCRLAEPGEFTRRAFLNGKLDLAQAESVADLIEAASAQAARAAVRSLDGAFSREVHALRDELVTLRMLVEATLDFPEEEIDFLKSANAWQRIDSLRTALRAILGRATQGARLRAGLTVVLAGRPNVGKSSLLNALAGEDAAIVTAVPGTTRDRIEKAILIDGMPLNVIDTAGLRDTNDEVEALGIARTRAAIAQADLVLHLIDATVGMTPDDERISSELPAGMARVTLLNKIDAAGTAARRDAATAIGDVTAQSRTAIYLSAKTGAGLDLLRDELKRRAGLEGAGEDVILARARHLDALTRAVQYVDAAVPHLDERALALELFAEELRLAQDALNQITGEFTPDDLLGEIFGRFCIGK